MILMQFECKSLRTVCIITTFWWWQFNRLSWLVINFFFHLNLLMVISSIWINNGYIRSVHFYFGICLIKEPAFLLMKHAAVNILYVDQRILLHGNWNLMKLSCQKPESLKPRHLKRGETRFLINEKQGSSTIAECILLMIAKSQWMKSGIAQFPLAKMSRHTSLA